jgi:hypothetical protein
MSAGEMKPLFVPLRIEYYEAFARGEKHSELRLYGPRWNERTCVPGRRVILSKGYGKENRMNAVIWQFLKRDAHTFGSTYQASVLRIFGTLDKPIAEIRLAIVESAA